MQKLIWLFVLCPIFAFGQVYKGYTKLIEDKANDLYEKEQYYLALPLYKSLDSVDAGALYSFRYGHCLYQCNQLEDAKQQLKKACKAKNQQAANFFYLGRIYHRAHQIDSARYFYTAFTKEGDGEMAHSYVERYLDQLEVAEKLLANPIPLELSVLGSGVNTKMDEYSPIVSADGSVLMFTSRRAENVGGKIDGSTGGYFEDVYISYWQDSTWSEAEDLGEIVNTDAHDACVSMTPDGQKLLIYRYESSKMFKRGNGDLYLSEIDSASWGTPILMDEIINTKHYEPSAFLTSDELTIVFASDREGGYGGTDLYEARLLPTGEWSEAKNLGPRINTPYNEDAPFITADGKTLYFSSEGHENMGGYDVFVAKQLGDTAWGECRNFGYPISTAEDDIYFSWSPDGSIAYFSSEREEGYGGKDIYKASVEPHPNPLFILKGIVMDSLSQRKLVANLTLRRIEDSTIVAVYNSNGYTGRYLGLLSPNATFTIEVSADGYYTKRDTIKVPRLLGLLEENRDFLLKKTRVGDEIPLFGVNFDYDSWELEPIARKTLDYYVQLLEENPLLILEIKGYTDSCGSEEYNQILSENRVLSVLDYFVHQGVSHHRLLASGKGETDLVKHTSAHDFNAANRRVVLKVVDVLKDTTQHHLLPTLSHPAFRWENMEKDTSESVNCKSDQYYLGEFLPYQIHFNVNQHKIYHPLTLKEIDHLAAFLRAHPRAVIELECSYKALATSHKNENLAQRREKHVRHLLEKEGVPIAQIKVKSIADEEPKQGEEKNEDEVLKYRKIKVKLIAL